MADNSTEEGRARPTSEVCGQVSGLLAAAHRRVSCFGVVLGKGYGLGAMAMTLGDFNGTPYRCVMPAECKN